MNLCGIACDIAIQSSFPCAINLILFLFYQLKGCQFKDIALFFPYISIHVASVFVNTHEGFPQSIINVLIGIKLQISF